MSRSASLLDPWITLVHTTQMFAEAQTVIAMRMLGMAGFWSVTPGETYRMVFEKPAAFTQAAQAAGTAMLSGKAPHQVAAAAINPIRRKTRANSRRLAKRGPKAF